MNSESLYIIHRNPFGSGKWDAQLFGEGVSRSRMEEAETYSRTLLGKDAFSYYGQLSEAQAIANALNDGKATNEQTQKATALLEPYREAYTNLNRLAHHILSVAEDEAISGNPAYAGCLVLFGQVRKNNPRKLESVQMPTHLPRTAPTHARS